MADQPAQIDFRPFRYDPNLGAAILFTILFFIMSFLHAYQVVKTKCWFYTAFVVGGYLEAVGYVAV